MGDQRCLQNLQLGRDSSSMYSALTIEEYIMDATDKVRVMVKNESRGHGDAGHALKRICSRHKLAFSRIFTVLYREPADVPLSVYLQICKAYDAELERQERIFAERRARNTKARTRLGSALLRLRDRLDREDVPALKDGEAP